jgi:hypothetical protein
VRRPLDEEDGVTLLVGNLIFLIDGEMLLSKQEDIAVEGAVRLRLWGQRAFARLVDRAALGTFD